MSRKCIVTQKGVMVGNNVSHANNKTRRRFLPNLQNVSFYSDMLCKKISLRVSTRGIRTIEFKGGIDQFLLKQKNRYLTGDLRKIKKQLHLLQDN